MTIATICPEEKQQFVARDVNMVIKSGAKFLYLHVRWPLSTTGAAESLSFSAEATLDYTISYYLKKSSMKHTQNVGEF